MTAPNEKEQSIISQLRLRVQDLALKDDSDMFLIRWIRGRDHDLTQAEAMLRKHMEWRRENDIDKILDWGPPQNITTDYPVDIIGFDLDNCPVGVVGFGRWDIRKFIERGQRSEFIRYIDQMYIKALDLMKGQLTREGVPVSQFVIIYDMDGLSMRTLTSYAALEAILETLRRFEANHPETLKRGFVVNASKVFTMLFTLVKPMLSQRTFGKIDIFGSNSNKWKPVLLEAVPCDILPTCLGGNNPHSVINKRTENQITKGEGLRMTNAGFKNLWVKAGEQVPVEIHVSDPSTVLSWEFQIQDYDIGFSILYEGKDEVVKYSRVEAGKMESEKGSVICSRPGCYSICFDNSYSRLRAKSIFHKISIK